MNSPSNGSRNRLLAALSHADRDLLAPALETIALDVRHVLEVPNDPISHVYFVESGLVSIVGTAAPDHRIEIGMVGYEGMTGLSIVLGGDRSANEALVQASGSALRIATESLREMLEASRSLTATLLRYVNVFMVQGSQTALANGRGRLDERLVTAGRRPRFRAAGRLIARPLLQLLHLLQLERPPSPKFSLSSRKCNLHPSAQMLLMHPVTRRGKRT
jgi:CRP-like cAMP-binding protein